MSIELAAEEQHFHVAHPSVHVHKCFLNNFSNGDVSILLLFMEMFINSG